MQLIQKKIKRFVFLLAFITAGCGAGGLAGGGIGGGNLAFAEKIQELPWKAREILENDFKVSSVIDYENSKDKKWYFVNGQLSDTWQNNVYAVNVQSPELSTILYENYLLGSQTVPDLVYNPANKSLYFMVDNGNSSEYGVRTYQDSGFYALSPAADGSYHSENLRRYYSLRHWVVSEVVKNYLLFPAEPDYKGFCKYFTDFADRNLQDRAVFCTKDENGNLLTGEAAAKYIYESDKLNYFINQRNKWGNFPLEDYVFVKDENGAVTGQPAVSYYAEAKEDKNFFNPNKDISSTRTDFFLLKDKVYFTVNFGSTHSDGKWHFDYAKIYQIKDDKEGFFIEEVELLKNIDFMYYEWNSGTSPISEIKNKDGLTKAVLAKDIDGKTLWYFDGQKVEKYKSDETFAEKSCQNKNNFEIRILLILLTVLGTITAGLIVALCLILKKQKRGGNLSSKSVYKIQEDEREKIAGDIHDSVVQDLRAIRIKAEMLEVKEASFEKHHQVIDEITLCITKIRDICYGLSPAELKDFGDDSELFDGMADFYSIIQSLGSQFTLRTNIPCTVKYSIDKVANRNLDNAGSTENSLLLPKEDCQNLVRIVQEALKNIEKHSFATQAQILIRQNKGNCSSGTGEIRIFITDNGHGCDLKKVLSTKNKNHFGLRMMKERANLIEGCQIDFRSALNDGMQVKIVLSGKGGHSKNE